MLHLCGVELSEAYGALRHMTHPVRADSQAMSTRLQEGNRLRTFAPIQMPVRAWLESIQSTQRMNKSRQTSTIECPPRSPSQPIELLLRVAGARLPLRIDDHADIETLRILKLGGTIKAAIPDEVRVPGGLNQSHRQLHATVDEITRVGRRMLDLFASRRTLSHLQAIA